MQNKVEIWKDIKNYNNLYQISNLGNVKSIKSNLILKGRDNGRGYLCVALSKNNKLKNFKIHQLVAIYFLNHTQCGMKDVINHKDGNKYNNDVDNLEITTQRINVIKHHLNNVKTSLFVGVSKYKDLKWRSTININNEFIHLGYFDKEIEASNIYQKALNSINDYNGNKKEFRRSLICQIT